VYARRPSVYMRESRALRVSSRPSALERPHESKSQAARQPVRSVTVARLASTAVKPSAVRGALGAVLAAPVVLAQVPCSITGQGFSIVPNVLPNPLTILLGILLQ